MHKLLLLNGESPVWAFSAQDSTDNKEFSPKIGLRGVLMSHAHIHESIPMLQTRSHSVVCQLMSVMAR